jgi:xanthine dehydrogenase small subunit
MAPDQTRPVRFFHRSAVVETQASSATRTVLDWLREDAHCTGTKEGCAEGDCGACMVVLGSLDAKGALQLTPVNACIQFVPTLDGKALFTVEDVAPAGGGLHPVQSSLVAHHGSQCGFCTPGFVMSLWALYQRHQLAGTVPTRQEIADALSGNLCRCTGYRPILDAGQQMFDLPAHTLATDAVTAALRALQDSTPLVTTSGFYAPRSISELATLRLQKPQAQLLAGSTDVGLWVNKQLRQFSEVIYVGEVAALKRVETTATHIHIGAGASLQAAWQALATQWPSLADVWQRFAALPLRLVGTMGGNVANGSPIGDSAPVLMALDATLLLQRGEHTRRLPLQDFYLAYMKNALQPGEFVAAIEVPLATNTQVQAYKISKRFDCDISAVCAGLAIQLDGERIQHVRLAWGGLAATVKRASAAEAAMQGQVWNEATLLAAQAALAQDFTPLSDMRASATYRLQVAQNLLRRFWLQTRPGQALPAAALSVWATA